MRIGFIGNIPPPIGGAEVFLCQFLGHFLKARPGSVEGRAGARHRSALLLRWRKQFFMYFPERVVRLYAPRGMVKRQGGLEVHYLFEAIQRKPYERCRTYDERLTVHYTAQALQATQRFKEARVELIHAHMLFPNLFFAATAARSLSVPLVLTIHGLLEFRLLDRFRTQYPNFAQRVEECLARADVVVAVSDEIARACRKRGARNVVKISGGVDTEVFRPPSSQPAGRDLVFLGSVRKEKGASLLIQAFERLDGSVCDLVFVGRRLLGGPIAERARRNPRIRFLGEQEGPAVRRALTRAKLVVLPSMSEGLPMSILEAMAHEKPVLVSACGELPHVIDDGRNGFLLRRCSPAALAQRIQAVVARDDLRQIGEAARRTAQAFDIRAVVHRYDALYQSLRS